MKYFTAMPNKAEEPRGGWIKLLGRRCKIIGISFGKTVTEIEFCFDDTDKISAQEYADEQAEIEEARRNEVLRQHFGKDEGPE